MGVYDGFGAMMGNYYGDLGASNGYNQAQQQAGNQQAQMMEALFSIAGANQKRQQWEQEQESQRQRLQQEQDYRNAGLNLERDRFQYGVGKDSYLNDLNLALQGLDPNMTPAQIALLRKQQIDEGMKMGKYGPNGKLVKEPKQRSIEDSTTIARLYDQLYSGTPQERSTAAKILKDQGEDAMTLPDPTGGGWMSKLGAGFHSLVSGDPSVAYKETTGYAPDDLEKRLREIHLFKQYAESIRGTGAPADNDALWKRVAEAHAEEKQLEGGRSKFKRKMDNREWLKGVAGGLWDTLANTPVGNRGPLNFF
jgi:hypothetical protein